LFSEELDTHQAPSVEASPQQRKLAIPGDESITNTPDDDPIIHWSQHSRPSYKNKRTYSRPSIPPPRKRLVTYSPKRSFVAVPTDVEGEASPSSGRKRLKVTGRGEASSPLKSSPIKPKLKTRKKSQPEVEDTPEETQRPAFIIPDTFSSSFDLDKEEVLSSPIAEKTKKTSRFSFSSDTSSLTSPDTSDLQTGSACPMCGKTVDEGILEDFKKRHPRMGLNHEQKFCLHHRKTSARSTWVDKGYPSIDWKTLDARIAKHHAFLQDILEGASCHYGQEFRERIKAGLNKTMHRSGVNLTPGYYGPRGLRVMSENLVNKFSSLLRKRSVQDRLVSARGHMSYVQSVLVPELTVRLIMDDMGLEAEEEAREVLKESISVGELLNEEVADVVLDDDDDEDSPLSSLSDSDDLEIL